MFGNFKIIYQFCRSERTDKMSRPFLIFIFCYFVVLWECKSLEDQPKLQSIDGHLYIVAARDKNITLVTSNRGYLNVNGINLVKAVQNAGRGETGSKDGRVNQLEDDVRVLQSRLEDAFQRLNVCENAIGRPGGIRPFDANSNTNARRIRNLNVRFARLQRQINTIIRNLTKNECQNDPCQNGATCLDRYLDFECQCEKGWEGKRCEKDVNECAQFHGTDLGCQNGATCNNKRGSYECICPPGYYGLHCTKRQNDCTSASSSELCGHGTCVSLTTGSKGFTCICDMGWVTNGVDPACTIDVDECTIAPCSRNPPVVCHNTPGGFFCGSCPPGYTGNGFLCEDINECLVNNGGCSVQPLVQCINTIGSSTCGPCPPGYLGFGKTCTFVGKCQVNNGGCHPNARCQEIGANVQCQCLPGYTGIGVGIEGCILIPGGSPTSNNPCEPNPCRNNGRCSSSSPNNFTCLCRIGFSGSRCETIQNPCESNPCENGGTCRQLRRWFFCTCPPNFMGRRCQIEKQGCGAYLLNDNGEIQFPPSGSSTRYSNNVNCAWIITVNHTKVIKITFDNFDLESGPDCPSDWLQIHDGRTTGDTLIGKYCGNLLPNNGTIITSGHNVYLWFRTDRTVNKMGFKLKWNATDPVCGGDVNASIHGTIRSPGSPGKYPPSRDCYWTVVAPLGQRITFTFFEVYLESHQNCSYDFLEFHESALTTSPVIARFCNTTTPAPLITPGNTALVHFHSDRYGSDRGFQIAYHPTPGYPGCGGIYSTKRGEIKPPTENGYYVNNLDCAWVIRLPEDFRIRLNFISVHIERSSTCNHDFLEIRDGSDISSDLLGKYCGSDLPAPIISSANQLFIRFYSDYSISLTTGFRINYQSWCVQTFTTDSGIIKSPGYPNQYRHDDECITTIEQPVGKIIELQFREFDMEFSFDCYFDYLEVRDGHDENSPLIGKYCGSNRPSTIVSTHNYLWMKLKTDAHIAGAGFYANYTTTDVTCGGIHKESTGVIRSPIRDNEYPPNQICRWVIAASTGQVISLTFTSFKLEHQPNCMFDSVSIYDNSSNVINDKLMGRFCGSEIPPPMTSTGNLMTIIFTTDSSYGMEGFTASYSFLNMSSACGGNFFSPSGTLRTPNYPFNYPIEKDCVWTLKVRYGRKITLKVKNFNLEPGINFNSLVCYDYLEIRDGGYDSSPLIGKYCGREIPKTITSQSNTLYLKFHSDGGVSSSGFEITWDGTLNGCGGTLTSVTGSITSPNYPQPYGSNSDCNYKISVSLGSVIQLNFMDLELEDSPDCILDYIEVYDGPDKNSKSLGRFCNANSHPPSVVSISNLMYIVFRSDMSDARKGFYIRYRTVCNTELKGNRGVIESPNFPNLFPPGMDCTWIILAPLGNKINISFSHLESSSPCSETYIEVKEGQLSTLTPTNVLGKYCETSTIPKKIASSLEKIYIHFVSSSDNAWRIEGKFRLEWVVNGCGGSYRKPSGEFTSPGYPNSYPQNTMCEWFITVEPTSSIKLVFSDINMEKSLQCVMDSVEVFGGADRSSPLLTKLCHSNKTKVEVESSGNQLYVAFKSDSSGEGIGFRANYFSIPAHCGGRFLSNFGSIHSRNYPQNYLSFDDCKWTIEVDTNHRVNLTFIDFDIEDGGDRNCTKNFVEVYDGSSTSAPSLLRHCGNSLPNTTTVLSTSNILTVRMRSDGENIRYTAKGFLANYSIACGATITALEPGVITLADHINMVEHNQNCSWIISTPEPDGHITITLNYLNIGPRYLNDSCRYNALEVYEGDTLLGRHCGVRTPLPMISKGNTITVKLISLRSNGGHQGHFSFTYSPASSACGGELSSERGSFASPNYPGSYPVNTECVWTLLSSPGNKIQLNFKEFNLESSPNCDEDYVEIRENDAKGKLIGVYCGGTQPMNLTSSGGIWVKFRSNSVGEGYSGFLADYSLDFGNELNGSSGQIASPFYPRSFIQYLDSIKWRIRVNFTKVIQISFRRFRLENLGNDCDSDFSHISIHDGYDETAPELLKACGTQKPDPVTSSSNVVFIKFVNFPTVDGSLFLLEWNEIARQSPYFIRPVLTQNKDCGGFIDLTSPDNRTTTITSPGYPFGYKNNLNCTWIVECPQEDHLLISFRGLDLAPTPNCWGQFVMVYSGVNGMSEWKKLSKLCRHNESSTELTASNFAKINFFSGYLGNRTGFSLTVERLCGGSIKKSNGLIKFDNWDHISSMNWHRNDMSCEWDITVAPGRTIEATFTMFNFGAHVDGTCQSKYIVLRNGGTRDSPLLGTGQYCTDPGITFRTTSNRMFVKIKSTYKSSTFVLSFQEKAHECGGHFEITTDTNETIITSPNYPNIPPPKVECIWVFVTSGENRLQIDFLERFDVAYSYQCTLEYVELRDGGTELSDEIGRFCGEKPSTQKSFGNMLYVKFYTNATDPKNGFKAKVSLARCGGVLRLSRGTLTSPGYPNSYESGIDCRWDIETDLSHQITVNVMDLDLPLTYQPYESPLDLASRPIGFPPSFSGRNRWTPMGRWRGPIRRRYRPSLNSRRNNCTTSASIIISEPAPPDNPETLYPSLSPGMLQILRPYLEISRERRNIILGNICSNDKPEPIKSSGHKITIVYNSGTLLGNRVTSRPRGFKLNFSSEVGGCDKNFDTASGVITSPNYPNARPNYYFCNFKITVPKGRRVTVKIEDIDFVGASSEQRLTLYHDHNYRSKIVMLTNENSASNTIYKSSSNIMLVNYWANTYSTASHRGFKLVYNSDEPAICGGSISDTQGTLASPKNQTGFYCEWEFPTRYVQNQTIAFTVYDSKIGNRSVTCNMRYASVLAIFSSGDSLDYETNICGNVTSLTVRSPYTNIKVLSVESTYYGPVDFNLKYKISSCGGPIYDVSEGVITSPSYPNNYSPDLDCAWLLKFPVGTTIKITIEDLQIEPSCNDYLTIKNGRSHDSPLIGKYCGNNKPDKFIVSEGHAMLIEFHSDSKNEGKGFKIRYEPANSVCGGIIHTLGAEIMTPNYPGDYGNNQECEWEIRTIEGTHIGLVFLDRFHLETSENCQNDFVKIYDYVNDNWKEIKTLCGRDFPTPVNSTSSRMKILFRSNSATTADGFKAKWERNCGGTIYGSKEGTIISPAYPMTYPNGLNCIYKFESPGDIINFNFTVFDLEGPVRGYCRFDSLEFFESGIFDRSQFESSGRYCGNTIPSARRMRLPAKVVFTSDMYSSGKGFVLNYFHDGCGGYINESQIIEYKGRPDRLNFLEGECIWNIEAPSDMIVVVRFLQARIKYNDNCRKGLTFYEGNSTNGKLLRRVCGELNTGAAIRSTSNRLTMKYSWYSYLEHSNFTASVVFSYGPQQGCGGKIDLGSNPEPVISPDINRDDKYEEFLDCVWLIYAKPFHYITANFIRLDMDSCNSTSCNCDYVEIRDGLDFQSDLLIKACGKTIPPIVTSSGDAIMIRMSTDGSFSGRGFHIEVSSQLSQCGYGLLTLNDSIQYLRSPNYPQNYPEGIRCKWIISSSGSLNSFYTWEGAYIHIDDWDIEDSVDCQEDYLSIQNSAGHGTVYETQGELSRNASSTGVEIIRGKNPSIYARSSEQLKICGKGSSLDFYSEDSTEVTVSFVSNSGLTKKGFQLEISRATCTRNYTAPWGKIKHTFFKNDSHCFMTITAPTSNHTISLYFRMFNMQSGDNECSTSYLEIRDGIDVNSRLIGKYCGYVTPPSIVSTGQNLWLHVYTLRGYPQFFGSFDITYVTTDQGSGCGGRIFSSSGVITSPSYPSNIRKYSTCRWDVVVPANLEVALTFTAFDIGPPNTCETDYIEFYDYNWNTDTETLRTKYCGGNQPSIVRSNTNGVIVKYVTSVHNGGTGWKMLFTAVAKGSENPHIWTF